jgi:hypothetical protein
MTVEKITDPDVLKADAAYGSSGTRQLRLVTLEGALYMDKRDVDWMMAKASIVAWSMAWGWFWDCRITTVYRVRSRNNRRHRTEGISMTSPTRRTRIYVAGPMTSSGNPYNNINRGISAATVLLDRGYAPYLPHLTCFWEAAVGTRNIATWLELDFAFLETCDAMLRLDGESHGADSEKAFALMHNIPVYHSLDTLCASEAPTR